MSKQNNITVEGLVVETLGNANFKCELSNGHILLCHISGKMRKNYIKIMTGDQVVIEMSPYDMERGRIVRRLKI